jgi:y4mF family transcriptional regulator
MFPLGNMSENTTLEAVAQLVRARRKALKLTQADLAMSSGTGLRFISDLENGKVTCQIGKVLHVLNTLGIRVQFSAGEVET